MSKKMIYLISFVLVLSLAHTGYGQVLIGNWETVMDGWLIDPCAPPGTTTSYSTTGVTLGAKSLKLTVPQGGWKQALYIPLDDRGLVNSFFDNDVFSLDITRLAAEWTGAPSNGWSNFHVIINANSALGPVWIDLGADNSAWTYRDANGTSTTSKWNYATAKARIDKASISNLDLILVSNYDPNYTSGGVYYLDKARLEPRSYLNVIGNFEHVMDGWAAGWEDSPVFAYASTGATLDGNSLSVTTNGGYWCLSWNAPVVPTSLKGVTLKFDLTMIASEWPSGHWTMVAAKIGLNSNITQPGSPDGWKEFTNAKAIDRTTGNPTALDWGSWSGDAKKTYSLDISNYNVTGATWFRISISIQGGNGTGHFYFDNVRLSSAGPAYGPNPANNERGVPTDAVLNLNWKPGLFAKKHDVYFGTDKTKVDSANRNNPLGVLRVQNYDSNTYSPGELAGGETYYWRIDEVNVTGPDPCSWKGDVWNFTTVYPPPGVVIGDWEDNMDGWVADQGNPTLSYSTTGATLNEKSLKIQVGSSSWCWVITLTLSPAQIEALKANDIISLDVTWVTSEWTGGSWAQVPGVAINAQGIGWNQVDPPTGDTSNPGSPGEWNPRDFGEIDTRTITWNYKDSDINDVANIPAGGYCYLEFATQFDPAFGTGTYYFDNARFLDSRVASNPNPKDLAKNVQTEPILRWKLGKNAKKHDVYFGIDKTKVTDANRANHLGVLVKQNYDTNSIDITADANVGTMGFETDYYWRIDEVNGVDIRKGSVWEFTTGRFLVVDDFESYNPSLANTWKTGGKAKVSLSTDPVHGEKQAMAIDYNNSTPAPYYSEAYANTTGPNSLSLSFGTNWLAEGVKGLSLWFRGYPDVRGSFTGADPYTLKAAGWDIWGQADGFHYAYKALTTTSWQITAKVVSVGDTDPWAKAGIMVRKTLEPGSMHATLVVTPENGIFFEWRDTAAGDSSGIQAPDANITAPHWLRLTRPSSSSLITAEHSSDGTTWQQVGDQLDLALYGSTGTPIYIGLCVSSHNSLELCTAQFSNVSMLKNFPPGTAITGSWADKDIGIPYNTPQKMYVVLKDSDSNGIVYNSDPNATQTGPWTHWGIELDEFSAQGVTLTDVKRIYIGVGNRGTPTQDGTGKVFVDDIRLYAPGCVLANRTAAFAKADYAPEGNPSGDCVVDFKEIAIMGRDWLKSPPPNPAVDLRVDNKIDFRDFAALAEFWLEEQMTLWP